MERIISLSKGQSIFVYIAEVKNPYIEQVIRDITYKRIVQNFRLNRPTEIYDI